MLEKLTEKNKKILIIIIVIIAIGAIYLVYNKIGNNSSIKLNEDILVSNNSSNTSENSKITEDEDIVVVHITGSVKTPGIVKLKEGSRIEDAIEAAGGLTDDADISLVNLAYILDDGTKIRIPSAFDEEIEEDDIMTDEIGENVVVENTSSTSSKTVNINKATQTELQTLPGIGASLASKIIEYREQNGKFKSIEDIKEVTGIGDNKYENIKNLISV